MTVPAILVDARNWAEVKPILIDKISKAPFTGFDLETHDADAHEGIKRYRGSNEAKIFDINRITICGFSLHFDDDNVSYYVNLNHADVENRVAWAEAKQVLEARNPDGYWVAHKAPFEMVMLRKAYDFRITNVICTMQMAVSAYGPDEYDFNAFHNAGLGEMKKLGPKAGMAFRTYESGPGKSMNADQAEVFSQICGKESKAAHSYNGFVADIGYGYNLKKAVKSWFGYQMTTFKECLGAANHMGELTGEQVAAYGADDAYWAVRLFHRLLQYMTETNPAVIKTFFEQENPMVEVYADLWATGMVVNPEGISQYRDSERVNCATVLQKLKAHVRSLLPFPPDPHEKLKEVEKWYRDNSRTYRARIESWANLPDTDDVFEQCRQASGAVSNAWCEDRKMGKPIGPNFTHYMMMRTLMYDLLREKPLIYKGKVQSDGEYRGKLIERLEGNERAIGLLECINELAGIEQRMKLYLTPYTLMTDPETGRMYPEVTSLLATRRMASSNPNGMQLAKQGQSTYVRGFFLPDNDDHVLVSMDWSQIELVLIGESSGDPEFAKAYGQVPYQDLHKVAAAELLSQMYDVVITPEQFASLNMMEDDVEEPFGFPLVDTKGRKLTPKAAYKFNRGTDGGKGMNFNYWYSGALSTVGERRGLSPDQMWAATDRYRQRFSVAEAWRTDLIASGRMNGFIQLLDNHRRVRFEATPEWQSLMRDRWGMMGDPGIDKFANEMIRATTTRAGNQLVNSFIQGGCATLAKRSILLARQQVHADGFCARFKMPIHDELLWSVRWNEVVPFCKMLKGVMTNHPGIVSKLKMDATASVGLTFEPWHAKKAPLGQIELNEAPKLECLPPETENKILNDDQIMSVVDWLRHRQTRLAA